MPVSAGEGEKVGSVACDGRFGLVIGLGAVCITFRGSIGGSTTATRRFTGPPDAGRRFGIRGALGTLVFLSKARPTSGQANKGSGGPFFPFVKTLIRAGVSALGRGGGAVLIGARPASIRVIKAALHARFRGGDLVG